MADDKGISPIGSEIVNNLQPVTTVDTPYQDDEIISLIELKRSEFPENGNSFTTDEILKRFAEVLKMLNDALSFWEKVKIFFGKMEAPSLSDEQKIHIIANTNHDNYKVKSYQ